MEQTVLQRPEILAPAGNADMLRAAVFAGADAVYLGLDGYNARRSAGNFDPDALREAVCFCHARGVAVHVTLNTLVYAAELGGLADAVRGADVFIGTSVAGALTTEMAATMAPDAIVFAMANPNPEIMPDAAKAAGVRVIGTGRSDFPNQVNNVLAFPGIFKGALSVRARDINPAMKMAAAKAIAGLIPDDELNEENILPKAFDPRVADAVAAAVAQAARESGVARV